MKKVILNIIIVTNSLLITDYSFSQAPEIEWQKTFGGTAEDDFTSMYPTSDGGIIMAGWSWSDSSGHKSEDAIGDGYWLYDDELYVYVHYEYSDFWIVKIDSLGNIEWENTIGGDASETIPYIIEIAGGNYIVGGNSSSGISGDKTELSISSDYWILKLDNNGNIIWQNTIGGDGGEAIKSIEPTKDGGFIIGGSSQSGISGDKTEALIGGPGAEPDLWIVKIDSIGNIEWENSIGGFGHEALYAPIQQTKDDGYIVGATSRSNISADKTENTNGASDYWIIKLSSTGSIEWQNTIGGNFDDNMFAIRQTHDNGFIVGGYSGSGIVGDKSEPNYGYQDYWVVKLDSIGNIQWQNTIGGTKTDHLRDIFCGPSGDYILAGYSSSNIGVDKSEACIGGYEYDYWIVNLNDAGEINWQNTIGGDSRDLPLDIKFTPDQKLIIGGFSNSPIGFDKTVDTIGGGDYWIMQLDCYGDSEICNAFDDNCNGINDDDVTELISITADGPLVFCATDSIMLNAAFTGETVQWKKNGINIPGAVNSTYTVKKKGYYTCETYSSCDTALSSSIYINVLKGPSSTITPTGPTEFCEGGSVELSANAGIGLSYQWFETGVAIIGATSINYLATIAGNYKCRVTKTFTGCYKMSNTINVIVPCRIGEHNFFDLQYNQDFNIYPNPNNGTFTITSALRSLRPLRETDEILLEIYTPLGQLIYSKQIELNNGNINETISINNLSSGIYFVRINIGNPPNATHIYSQQKLIMRSILWIE